MQSTTFPATGKTHKANVCWPYDNIRYTMLFVHLSQCSCSQSQLCSRCTVSKQAGAPMCLALDAFACVACHVQTLKALFIAVSLSTQHTSLCCTLWCRWSPLDRDAVWSHFLRTGLLQGASYRFRCNRSPTIAKSFQQMYTHLQRKYYQHRNVYKS